MDKVVHSQNIKEGELDKIPDFYISPAGNAFYSRLDDSVHIKQNIPRLVEVIKGQMLIYKVGSFVQGEILVPFKTTYGAKPHVEGLVKMPDNATSKLPALYTTEGTVTISQIRNSSLDLTYSGTNLSNAGKVIVYKLRVYDLSIDQ